MTLLETKDPHIPTYLFENGIEFFAMNGDAYMIKNGQVTAFGDFDQDTLCMIKSDYDNDLDSQRGLDRMGMKNSPIEERLKQHLVCKYGQFDTKADIQPDGSITPEYYDCGRKGKCKGEGLSCKPISSNDIPITKRQVEILRAVAAGLGYKQIATKLFISESTVNSHIRNIQIKIGGHNAAFLSAFAVSKNLI